MLTSTSATDFSARACKIVDANNNIVAENSFILEVNCLLVVYVYGMSFSIDLEPDKKRCMIRWKAL